MNMISDGAELDMQEHEERESEFRLCKGNYVGIVRHSDNQYEFLVRDIRKECPTIHGGGVDLAHAMVAVTQLLDALDGLSAGRPSTATQW